MPTVLVATDADSVGDLCMAAVGGEYHVVRVNRGQAVLDAVASADPDVVVLDLQIANMGAMAVCLAIRQEEEMGRLAPRPVLLLLDREADEFLARRSGADEWLVKPVSFLRLARAVRSLHEARPAASIPG